MKKLMLPEVGKIYVIPYKDINFLNIHTGEDYDPESVLIFDETIMNETNEKDSILAKYIGGGQFIEIYSNEKININVKDECSIKKASEIYDNESVEHYSSLIANINERLRDDDISELNESIQRNLCNPLVVNMTVYDDGSEMNFEEISPEAMLGTKIKSSEDVKKDIKNMKEIARKKIKMTVEKSMNEINQVYNPRQESQKHTL